MADISKIVLPNNSEYNLKDSDAVHDVKTINNQSIEGTGNINIEGVPHVNLTQAQYDELTPEEKNNGDIYFVTDGHGIDLNSGILLDYVYPVGSVYVADNNTFNPNNAFGGTWALIDKDFGYHWINNAFTFNTTNTSNGSSAFLLHGNTIEFRLYFTNRIAPAALDMVIGTFNASSIGILPEYGHTMYAYAYSETLDAIALLTFGWSWGTTDGTCTVKILDWVSRSSSYPTTTGAGINLSFVFVVESSDGMIDSFCNKFYWKRTA